MWKTVVLSFLSSGITAQQLCAQSKSPDSALSTGVVALEELKALKERIAQQSEQIKKLGEVVEQQRKLLDQAVATAEAGRAQTGSENRVLVRATKAAAGSAPLVPAVDREHHAGIVLARGGQNLQSRN